jgi:hypothetical protein
LCRTNCESDFYQFRTVPGAHRTAINDYSCVSSSAIFGLHSRLRFSILIRIMRD